VRPFLAISACVALLWICDSLRAQGACGPYGESLTQFVSPRARVSTSASRSTNRWSGRLDGDDSSANRTRRPSGGGGPRPIVLYQLPGGAGQNATNDSSPRTNLLSTLPPMMRMPMMKGPGMFPGQQAMTGRGQPNMSTGTTATGGGTRFGTPGEGRMAGMMPPPRSGGRNEMEDQRSGRGNQRPAGINDGGQRNTNYPSAMRSGNGGYSNGQATGMPPIPRGGGGSCGRGGGPGGGRGGR
jgi:hypothetical protein